MPHSQPILVAGLESLLFDEAVEASRLAATATAPREEGAKAMMSIILAVAAVEAQTGIWAAIFGTDYQIDSHTLRRWRRRAPQDILKEIFARLKPPITVANVTWYNHLCAIVALRNHVAHYFPEFRTPGTWPDALKGYITNGTFRPTGDDTMDWTSRILVAPVSSQVVDYAREIMDGFVSIAWRPA